MSFSIKPTNVAQRVLATDLAATGTVVVDRLISYQDISAVSNINSGGDINVTGNMNCAGRLFGTTLQLPVLTTATRPATPLIGELIFNGETQRLEVYDSISSSWKVVTFDP